MSAGNFERCVEIVFGHEGGFANHPDDPGGATQMGITHATLREWRDGPVTEDDVKNLTRREAMAIYRANYWNVVHADQLPAGVDLVVFDMAVNAGPARAAKLLQNIVGVPADGVVGPKTLSATLRHTPGVLVASYSAARMRFYRRLSTWRTFGTGWTRRVRETEDHALSMTRSETTSRGGFWRWLVDLVGRI
jgi:lysozyme family protein